MRRFILLSLGALGLAACLPAYQIPQMKSSAEFKLAARSGPESTNMRVIYVWAFKNEECEKSDFGMRAGSSIANDPSASTAPVQVVAGEKFVFTAGYIDARFGQNRKCAITAAFTPLSNRRYEALLLVSDGVESCRLGIYDITSGQDEQVEFSMPKHLCEDQGKSALLNGQPLWTNYQIRVAPYRAR